MCETNDKFVFKKKISSSYLKENSIKKKIKIYASVTGSKESFKPKLIDNSFPDYLIRNKYFYRKWIA